MAATISWEQFVLRGETDHPIRKEILDSWKKCRELGVSHEMDQVVSHTSKDDFQKRRERNELLLKAAKPVMEELYSHLKGGGYLLLLADAEGYLLERMADTKAQRICDHGGIYPGAKWLEDSVGSTGLSIALRTRRAMATSATEHYCAAFRKWDCSACPIYVEGEFVGVFDVCRISSGNDLRELYSLAVTGARAVSERLCFERKRIEGEILSRIVMSSWDINLNSTGILSFDEHGTLIHKNKMASQYIQQLQQEDSGYNFYNQVKNRLEKEPSIYMEGKKYLLESKQLTKQNRNLATVILVKPDHEIKTVFSSVDGLQGEMSEIHKTFQTKNLSFKKIINTAAKAAMSNASILLKGETGTGKDFMARAIHRQSKRSENPFIALNCASLPKELIASELFGYVGGAFTGAQPKGNAGKIEAAHGGTLFLDEIAEMPMELQAVLLRTLEEKQITRIGSTKPIPVDVRFIAASHKNLHAMIEKGQFREDLFYRLNVFSLELPSLRERLEDLGSMVENMIAISCEQAQRERIAFSPQAIELFKTYSWPGNLRELRNIIEKITYLHEPNYFEASNAEEFLPLEATIKDSLTEREQIERLLSKVNGNRSQAARELHLSRSAFYRKLEKYGLLKN